MKIVPVVKCKDMQESLSFYRNILGFEVKNETASSPVINLVRGEAELQLSVLSGDGEFGCAVNVLVEEVDELFKTFCRLGLDPSRKKESPVHQGPVNQSWGRREFYVDDPNGNTLRFSAPIR